MGKRRGFAVVVAVLMLLLVAGPLRAENPEWVKNLFNITVEKSVGLTYTYDVDQHVSGTGAKWNPVKLFNGYVSAGLFAYLDEPSLGVNAALDVAKIVRKGKPAVQTEGIFVMEKFDIGGWATWTSLDNFFDRPFNADLTGVFGTVVKLSW